VSVTVCSTLGLIRHILAKKQEKKTMLADKDNSSSTVIRAILSRWAKLNWATKEEPVLNWGQGPFPHYGAVTGQSVSAVVCIFGASLSIVTYVLIDEVKCIEMRRCVLTQSIRTWCKSSYQKRRIHGRSCWSGNRPENPEFSTTRSARLLSK